MAAVVLRRLGETARWIEAARRASTMKKSWNMSDLRYGMYQQLSFSASAGVNIGSLPGLQSFNVAPISLRSAELQLGCSGGVHAAAGLETKYTP